MGRDSNKNSLNEQYILNDELINDPKTIADSFCEYFSSVGNKFASAIPPSNKPPEFYFTKHGKSKKSIFLSPTDTNEIINLLKNLKPKKSTGHDNINSQFLIRNKQAIAVPISILINKSLENGEVPTDCKVAKVVPIHKSKSKK